MIVPALSARRSPSAARRALLLVLLLLSAASAAIAQTSAQEDSLARGGVQVIANGLTAPPAGDVTWRVVRHQVQLQADAQPSNRLPSAAGFLLADGAPIFISDQQTKQRYRLAPGEAQFVPTGANQTWASLGEGPAASYSIELVDRERADAAESGEVLFTGSGFEMPVGDYDLDLLRGLVRQGERARIAAGEYPTVVFATSGSVKVTSTEADEPVVLERGQGVMLRGDLSIDGGRERSSTFVAGAIGGAVTGGVAGTPVPTATPTSTAAPEETPEPTATDEPEEERTPTPEPENVEPAATPQGASLRIAVRLCREGMNQANLNPRGCQRADGNYRLALVRPDGERLRLNDATRVEPHFVRWSGLEPGVYQLIVGDLPRGYITYSLDGFPCCPIPNGWPITITENAIYDGTLYLLQDANPVAVRGQTSEAPRNPPPANLSGDADGDGLLDAQELDYWGTSPQSIDSDGDTIPDGVEAYGSNGYRTKPAQWDSDGDGVADNVEIERGSNPNG